MQRREVVRTLVTHTTQRYRSSGAIRRCSVIVREDAIFLLETTGDEIERHVPVPLVMSATLHEATDQLHLQVRGEHDIVLTHFATGEEAADCRECTLRLVHEAVLTAAKDIGHVISGRVLASGGFVQMQDCNLRKAVEFLDIPERLELRKKGLRRMLPIDKIDLETWDTLLSKPPAAVEEETLPEGARGIFHGQHVVMSGPVMVHGGSGGEARQRYLVITPDKVHLCAMHPTFELERWYFIVALHSVALNTEEWPPRRMELRLVRGRETDLLDIELCTSSGDAQSPSSQTSSLTVVSDILLKLAARHGVSIRTIHRRGSATTAATAASPDTNGAAKKSAPSSPRRNASPKRSFGSDSFFSAAPKVSQLRIADRVVVPDEAQDATPDNSDDDELAERVRLGDTVSNFGAARDEAMSEVAFERKRSSVFQVALNPLFTVQDYSRPRPEFKAAVAAIEKGYSKVQLVRPVKRFTSAGGWVARLLVLLEGTLVMAEKNGTVRRAIPWSSISRVHIMSRSPATLCIFVSGRNEVNLIVRAGEAEPSSDTARIPPLLDSASVLKESSLNEISVTRSQAEEPVSTKWLTRKDDGERPDEREDPAQTEATLEAPSTPQRGPQAADDADDASPDLGDAASPTAGLRHRGSTIRVKLSSVKKISDYRNPPAQTLSLLGKSLPDSLKSCVVLCRKVARFSTHRQWLQRIAVLFQAPDRPMRLILVDHSGKVHRTIVADDIVGANIYAAAEVVTLNVVSEPCCILRADPKGSHAVADLVAVIKTAIAHKLELTTDPSKPMVPGEITLLQRSQSLRMMTSPMMSSASFDPSDPKEFSSSMSSSVTPQTTDLKLGSEDGSSSPLVVTLPPALSMMSEESPLAASPESNTAGQHVEDGQPASPQSLVMSPVSGANASFQSSSFFMAASPSIAFSEMATPEGRLITLEAEHRLALLKEEQRIRRPSVVVFRRVVHRLALAHEETVARAAIEQEANEVRGTVSETLLSRQRAELAAALEALVTAVRDVEAAEEAARVAVMAIETTVRERVQLRMNELSALWSQSVQEDAEGGSPNTSFGDNVSERFVSDVSTLVRDERHGRGLLILEHGVLSVRTEAAFVGDLAAQCSPQPGAGIGVHKEVDKDSNWMNSTFGIIAQENQRRRGIIDTEAAFMSYSKRTFRHELLLVASGSYIAEFVKEWGSRRFADTQKACVEERNLLRERNRLVFLRTVTTPLCDEEAAARRNILEAEDDHWRDAAGLMNSLQQVATSSLLPPWVLPQLRAALTGEDPSVAAAVLRSEAASPMQTPRSPFPVSGRSGTSPGPPPSIPPIALEGSLSFAQPGQHPMTPNGSVSTNALPSEALTALEERVAMMEERLLAAVAVRSAEPSSTSKPRDTSSPMMSAAIATEVHSAAAFEDEETSVREAIIASWKTGSESLKRLAAEDLELVQEVLRLRRERLALREIALTESEARMVVEDEEAIARGQLKSQLSTSKAAARRAYINRQAALELAEEEREREERQRQRADEIVRRVEEQRVAASPSSPTAIAADMLPTSPSSSGAFSPRRTPSKAIMEPGRSRVRIRCGRSTFTVDAIDAPRLLGHLKEAAAKSMPEGGEPEEQCACVFTTLRDGAVVKESDLLSILQNNMDAVADTISIRRPSMRWEDANFRDMLSSWAAGVAPCDFGNSA